MTGHCDAGVSFTHRIMSCIIHDVWYEITMPWWEITMTWWEITTMYVRSSSHRKSLLNGDRSPLRTRCMSWGQYDVKCPFQSYEQIILLTDTCSQLYVVQQLRNVDLHAFSFSTRVDNIWLVLWANLMYHVIYGHIYPGCEIGLGPSAPGTCETAGGSSELNSRCPAGTWETR